MRRLDRLTSECCLPDEPAPRKCVGLQELERPGFKLVQPEQPAVPIFAIGNPKQYATKPRQPGQPAGTRFTVQKHCRSASNFW